MAKFYGVIGYGISVDKGNGIWKKEITEKSYYGDILTIRNRNEVSGYVNDNINVNNRISIVADAFAYQHFSEILYIVWMKTRWKVKSIEVVRPRLILEVGGVYNGTEGPSSENP